MSLFPVAALLLWVATRDTVARPVLWAIVAGNAQFTPLDLTGLLLAAGGKQPITGFTAVAGIQQRTMAAIISLQGNGINTPKDLEGKTLTDSPSSVVRNLFPTYAKADPTLWGFPFFFWYQFLWVFLCSGMTYAAYRLTLSARRKDGER